MLAHASNMGDLSRLPDTFRDSSDLYILMHLQHRIAKKEKKQVFTYIDLTRTEMLHHWFTDEAPGGVSTGIADELKFATDNGTSGIMALYNGIN